tara:strand:- start:778 stop:1530 length:753 start_codon:yes stop_codon:yes gene_type:complete
MKKSIAILALSVFIFGCKEDPKNEQKNDVETIKENETSSEIEDWTVLFDGSSFENWKEYLNEGVSDNWKLEDNAMVFYPPKDRKNGQAFNLVTKKEYTDFVLSLDWRISEGGNSGIFWGVKEDPSLPEAYQTGPEIQVLDNEKHPDAKAGTTHQAGSLYDMIPPLKDVTKPIGEWNNCVLTINHKTNQGSVVLNGVEIVTFPVNNPEWGVMVSKSKFADWSDFGKYPTGKIGLQDHGDMVSYRNVKIKEL